ncbi:MAG TPA: tyrosine-type recombinase/integrase [Gemmataceae bacterium]|nr:tyrosine-type recombinase/integrase [Gemmataceae bacterium]
MSDKRIKVWVQRFKDRSTLMLQWIDPDTGRRKSKSAETAEPKKAEEARIDLESDLNNGRHREQSRMSWKQFRELFEAEYLPGVRPDTRAVYHNVFNLFERLSAPRLIRAINERIISAFVAGLRKLPGRRGTGMEASTIKTRLQFLHTALTWAETQNFITCPTFPTVRVPKRKPQAVPEESFERLLEKATNDPQLYAFLLCGWLAGLRRKEAMAMEWEESERSPWVNLARNRIILPASFVKADEDQWVPLDPKLRETLLALPRHGTRVFRFLAHNRRPLSLTGISDRISELARKAGVKLSMKSLRRGFGCRYAGRVPAQVLRGLMRHANIKTTMDYYANVDDAVEEAILGPNRNSLRNKDHSALGTEKVGFATRSMPETDK